MALQSKPEFSSDPHIQEDGALLRETAEGDHEAFRLLVERYQDKVFRICLGFLLDAHEAEDLSQEVFFQIYRNAGRFRGKSKVSTWIYRIAANRSMNRLRYRRARQWLRFYGSAAPASNPVNQAADRDENPDASLARQERRELIRRALRRLPSNQRLAIVLHSVEGISHQEIAGIQGCTVSAVEARIHRARQNLRVHLVHLVKKGQ